MRIAQVCTADLGGGAEKVAWDLHTEYLSRGLDSRLLVGRKYSSKSTVFQMNGLEPAKFGRPGMVRNLRSKLAYARRLNTYSNALLKKRGIDTLRFPESYEAIDRFGPVDILHLHNLHGEYFDLEALPILSKQVPTILTLHDCWMLTGHCAHPLDCLGWINGCHPCPHLDQPRAICRDSASDNLRRREEVIEASELHLATPSQWLMEMVNRSVLRGVHNKKVIPNGVRTDIFLPTDQVRAKKALGLGPERHILFVGTSARNNFWKDYGTLERAIARVPRSLGLKFVVVGDSNPKGDSGDGQVIFKGRISDPQVMASCYNAADIYVHPSKVDTFPTAVLEAMACGLPVIATSVGGIPEQITHERNGLLVPRGDDGAMAEAIENLIGDEGWRKEIGMVNREKALEQFDLRNQADSYLSWYRELADMRE